MPDGERFAKAVHPEELVYTWQFTGPDSVAKADPPSRVSFRLERISPGTRLTVVHDQLVEGTQTASMITFGWPHVIAGLKTLLETGEAIDFTSPDLDASGGHDVVIDLGIWAGCYQPAPYCRWSDYNCDGTVDVVDLGLWAGGIHLECGQTVCP